ncbi:anti-sigma factor domain-containing protein [Lederbergia wuyishanensis]|uniref:Thiaminase n=1 Tax=Lederbergia wuyishanensis TaxID=1347903 RepID=A0ABU0D881_9BACI|nr:anti-sigma factor [Lederbergia wuyishanensis]MCJ8009273.1 anti-sigma factor [Lederbergia wuyishanensis]MDQ0344593.1 thiaminase [Lederbergia wuyishanensis]
MNCPHWTDEQMIDYILGKTREEDTAAIHNSIATCEICYENYTLWKNTLPHQDLEEPSKFLKRRVMNSYKSKTQENKIRLPGSVGWKASSSIAIIGVALLLFVVLDVFPKQSAEPLTDHSMFVMNNDTDVYELQPEVSRPTKGYAWINNRTKEIYLFVDGLPPLENQDYQAWVKTYSGLYDAGILQLLGERGQLYRKSEPLEKVEYIIVSVEPKGGSRVPTEEHLQVIKVKAKKSNL